MPDSVRIFRDGCASCWPPMPLGHWPRWTSIASSRASRSSRQVCAPPQVCAVLVAAVALFAPAFSRATGVALAYAFPARLTVEVTPGAAKVRAGQPLTISARVGGVAAGVVPTLTVRCRQGVAHVAHDAWRGWRLHADHRQGDRAVHVLGQRRGREVARLRRVTLSGHRASSGSTCITSSRAASASSRGPMKTAAISTARPAQRSVSP